MTTEHSLSSAQNQADSASVINLGNEDTVRKIVSSTILSLWDAVNNLTRLRPSKHERDRIAIFGSARAEPGSWVYEEVERVALHGGAPRIPDKKAPAGPGRGTPCHQLRTLIQFGAACRKNALSLQ